ncbi:MAG TPA: hypothetical protein DEF85_06040 [Clostridiaceae bacterium]|nr:hypothetical protein [Clostridiaceae bacterium]
MDKKLGDLYKIECDDTIPENEVDLKDSGEIIGKIINVNCNNTVYRLPGETDAELRERIKNQID